MLSKTCHWVILYSFANQFLFPIFVFVCLMKSLIWHHFFSFLLFLLYFYWDYGRGGYKRHPCRVSEVVIYSLLFKVVACIFYIWCNKILCLVVRDSRKKIGKLVKRATIEWPISMIAIFVVIVVNCQDQLCNWINKSDATNPCVEIILQRHNMSLRD